MKSIIELAREAGLYLDRENTQYPLYVLTTDELTCFAALVRAQTLEEAAVIVEQAAMAYAEPVWAQEIVTDIRDRKEKP